jgi:hypothetical protein
MLVGAVREAGARRTAAKKFVRQTFALDPMLTGTGVEVNEADDLLAEIVALNQAVTRALVGLAALAGQDGLRDEYVAALLENGLRDLGQTRFVGMNTVRLDRVIEKARARYTEIVMSLNTGQ